MLTSTLAFATDLLFIWRNLRPFCSTNCGRFNSIEKPHTRNFPAKDIFMIHCKSVEWKYFHSVENFPFFIRRLIKLFIISFHVYLTSTRRDNMKGRRLCKTVPKSVVIIKSCFYEQINVQLIAPSYLPSKQWAHNLLFRSLWRNLGRSWSEEVEAFSLLAMINYMEEIYS